MPETFRIHAPVFVRALIIARRDGNVKMPVAPPPPSFVVLTPDVPREKKCNTSKNRCESTSWWRWDNKWMWIVIAASVAVVMIVLIVVFNTRKDDRRDEDEEEQLRYGREL